MVFMEQTYNRFANYLQRRVNSTLSAVLRFVTVAGNETEVRWRRGTITIVSLQLGAMRSKSSTLLLTHPSVECLLAGEPTVIVKSSDAISAAVGYFLGLPAFTGRVQISGL
jgi:hypothetical protein